jgi:SAM-dependent methyltransferase
MGLGQTWDPEGYARHARFVAELGLPVVDLLGPQPGERILDLGCGDGALTEKLAALGCEVVGVDSSPAQVDAARARGLEAYVVDARDLPFATEFDAVFSNAALHWMGEPDGVITGVARALRPAGRFVGEMGGQGNIATILNALEVVLARRGVEAAALNPWTFPGPEDYRARLERCGFAVDTIDLFARPTTLPGDIAGWLETFGGSFLAPFRGDEWQAVVDELRPALAPSLRDAGGTWTADYVRLRFAAHLRRYPL